MTKIFVNGTFDIIHVGHIELLEYAKSWGDHLTLALDTDRRIKQLKGPNRPINSEYERYVIMRSLRCVDEVVFFDTDDDLINLIKDCDIMVKGGDYRGKPIIGQEHAKQIVYFDRIDGYSTTSKIEKIMEAYNEA